MRPLSFDPQAIRKHLLRHKIATLPELKGALGTATDLTVFRKLKLLDYLSSYTHRGRYYALREVAHFDDAVLWSHQAVWFSRYGTPVSTVESFVNQSPRGWFADELADTLHAEVQDPLHDLVRAVAPPYPGAFTEIEGERLRVLRTRLLPPRDAARPAAFLHAENGRVLAACADGGTLELLEAELDGKPQSAQEFAHRIGARRVPLS